MKKLMTLIGIVVSVVLVGGLVMLVISGNLGNAVSAFSNGFDRGYDRGAMYKPSWIEPNLYTRPNCFPNRCDFKEMGKLMCIEEAASANGKFKDFGIKQLETAIIYRDNPTGLQCAVSLLGPDSDPTYLVVVGVTGEQLKQNYGVAYERLSR